MAKMTIDDLVSQMQLAFGAELKAVVLYGSGARANGAPSGAAQNVLIVVERITMDTLAQGIRDRRRVGRGGPSAAAHHDRG